MPFNWKKRRDKELLEVKTIYKELKRREDLINQYNLKSSILKGEAKVRDLEDYLEEKKNLESVNEIMIFKEKKDNEYVRNNERKLPRV